LTMSSAVLVGLRLRAEVRAFSMAISGVAGLAPSRRSRWSRKPDSSTTAIETGHWFFNASDLAEETILLASSRVRENLVRIFVS